MVVTATSMMTTFNLTNFISHSDARDDIRAQVDEEDGDGPERHRNSEEDADNEGNHFRNV